MPRSATAIKQHRQQLHKIWGVWGPYTPLGNRCGHIRDRPRQFARPASWDAPPPWIRKSTERFWDYYHHPERFATLARAPRRRLGKIMRRLKIMRSERREACVLMWCAFVHRCHAPSMRVCIRNDYDHRKVRGVYLTELAEMAGISLSRATRAIQDLIAVGFVTAHPSAAETEPGRYEGRATIYKLFDGIFTALGLKRTVGKARGETNPKGGNRAQGRRLLKLRAEWAWMRLMMQLGSPRRRGTAGGPEPPMITADLP